MRFLSCCFIFLGSALAFGQKVFPRVTHGPEVSIAPKDCIAEPCSSSTNFAFDLAGVPDTRPGTYGTAEAMSGRITFSPPAGYRVHILRVYGDFIGWPVGVVPEGTAAGVLFALGSTGVSGSTNADFMADGCFLYIQDSTMGKPLRDPYDFNVRAGGLLEADNVLVLTAAVWLNTTGLKIHMEPTFVAVYRFEKVQ